MTGAIVRAHSALARTAGVTIEASAGSELAITDTTAGALSVVMSLIGGWVVDVTWATIGIQLPLLGVGEHDGRVLGGCEYKPVVVQVTTRGIDESESEWAYALRAIGCHPIWVTGALVVVAASALMTLVSCCLAA